jgi:hypothetical protein
MPVHGVGHYEAMDVPCAAPVGRQATPARGDVLRRGPAAAGADLAEVDTPALVVDLATFERNLDRMPALLAPTGVAVRPHAKTHKSPEVAAQQIARGAVGVCVAKVAEAEAMVAGGVEDVLVANEVVGRTKLCAWPSSPARLRSVCAWTTRGRWVRSTR